MFTHLDERTSHIPLAHRQKIRLVRSFSPSSLSREGGGNFNPQDMRFPNLLFVSDITCMTVVSSSETSSETSSLGVYFAAMPDHMCTKWRRNMQKETWSA